MIIVDNIAEYETLSTIKNFCKNHDECKGCLYNFMCSFFNKDIVPEKWEIKLELKKDDSKKTQDIDITLNNTIDNLCEKIIEGNREQIEALSNQVIYTIQERNLIIKVARLNNFKN